MGVTRIDAASRLGLPGHRELAGGAVAMSREREALQRERRRVLQRHVASVGSPRGLRGLRPDVQGIDRRDQHLRCNLPVATATLVRLPLPIARCPGASIVPLEAPLCSRPEESPSRDPGQASDATERRPQAEACRALTTVTSQATSAGRSAPRGVPSATRPAGPTVLPRFRCRVEAWRGTSGGLASAGACEGACRAARSRHRRPSPTSRTRRYPGWMDRSATRSGSARPR
jgi:hypothetical protein